MESVYYVYILRSRNRRDKTYVGCTNNLRRRLSDHNSGQCIFTKELAPWVVVYFEKHSRENAIEREKQINRWSREKKEALIRGMWGG